MPNFIYTTISKEGKKETLTAQAESEEELLNQLQSQGLTVTNIVPQILEPAQPEKRKIASPSIKVRQPKVHRRVYLSDLVLLAKQLSTMLNAGVTLFKSLEVISVQLQSQRLLKAVETIKKDVEQGRNFSDALSAHPGVFPKLWVNLAEAGEASGNLPLVLERLAGYIEARSAFRSQVISAMIYPVILLAVAIGSIFIFTTLIVPKFTSIFISFQLKLPLITRLLISLSNFLRHGIIYLIAGIIIFIFSLSSFIKTRPGKRLFDKIQLQLPVLGEFIQAVNIENFASEISMLLESGVPILYALEVTQHSMDNILMEEAVGHIKDSVRQGQTFHVPMQESGLFPAMVTQMVSIGEEIGELPKMCKQIATYYQERVAIFITRLTAMLEPIMIVFMGVIIGTMVVAMYLPIFQMATGGSFSR